MRVPSCAWAQSPTPPRDLPKTVPPWRKVLWAISPKMTSPKSLIALVWHGRMCGKEDILFDCFSGTAGLQPAFEARCGYELRLVAFAVLRSHANATRAKDSGCSLRVVYRPEKMVRMHDTKGGFPFSVFLVIKRGALGVGRSTFSGSATSWRDSW